jgi:2-polyprenyl-6-hydroxyphenyl methylase/3-demethylubiquinone-9 3-methyltransferase
MTYIESTVDAQEVAKFSQHALHWWDKKGPLKTLHDINPTRLEFINKHCNLTDINVLDVGCGGGILSEAMAKQGAVVTGIDAEYEAIQAASIHAKKNQLIIDYNCTPIEEYEHTGFDVVTCMELLEHVQRPELILKHCKRLLKPNGLLFLSTISRTIKAYTTAIIAAEYVLGLLPKQTHDFKKFIKPSELASMARSFNLNLLELSGLNYNPLMCSASLVSDVSVNYLMVLQAE